MNSMRLLLQNSNLCTNRSTIGAHQVMRKLCSGTHQVTEKELPLYVDNVTSLFNLHSYTVLVRIMYRPYNYIVN